MGWVVKRHAPAALPRERDPVPNLQEAVWAPVTGLQRCEKSRPPIPNRYNSNDDDDDDDDDDDNDDGGGGGGGGDDYDDGNNNNNNNNKFCSRKVAIAESA